jgi:hypothetical protein
VDERPDEGLSPTSRLSATLAACPAASLRPESCGRKIKENEMPMSLRDRPRPGEEPDLPPSQPELPVPGDPVGPDVYPDPMPDPQPVPPQDPQPPVPGEITPPVYGWLAATAWQPDGGNNSPASRFGSSARANRESDTASRPFAKD